MRRLNFLFIVLSLLWTSSAASSVLNSFTFDPERHHISIAVSEKGWVASKLDGEDYQTVLLKPTIPAEGRSYVEFEIEDQAESQCFMGFGTYGMCLRARYAVAGTELAYWGTAGVCKGTHDYFGGRSAMAAAEAWMLSTQSGKFYSNEGESKQFLSGMGTDPFYPGDDAVTLRSVRPRVGDKVGLLVDMGRGEVSVYCNGVSQGVMAENIPEGVNFAVDLSDAGQKVRVVKDAHVPEEGM